MKAEVQAFRQTVRNYYKKHGRHELPWRHTTDPYKILVSEVMLQQTQVDRVRPKYELFIKTYPSAQVLAKAPLGAVLSLWVGLGYNRRAKFLKQAAEAVVVRGGVFPTTTKSLTELPGVGPYTAGAVAAFAYNLPVVMIETNIRTVFIYHFFKERTAVADSELLPLILQTLDKKNPREWYYALMDYGVYLKKTYGSNNHQSKHHVIQKPFKGSIRAVRGAIVRQLAGVPAGLTLLQLGAAVEVEKSTLERVVQSLCVEGLVTKKRQRFTLAT